MAPFETYPSIEEIYKYLERWNIHLYFDDSTDNWCIVDSIDPDSRVNLIKPNKDKDLLARAAMKISLD